MGSERNSMTSFFFSFIFFVLGLIMFMYAVGSLEYKGQVLEEDTRNFTMSCSLGFGFMAIILGIAGSIEQKGKKTVVYVPVATQGIKVGQLQYVVPNVSQKIENKTCIECGQENNADSLSCILCSGSRFRKQ